MVLARERQVGCEFSRPGLTWMQVQGSWSCHPYWGHTYDCGVCLCLASSGFAINLFTVMYLSPCSSYTFVENMSQSVM